MSAQVPGVYFMLHGVSFILVGALGASFFLTASTCLGAVVRLRGLGSLAVACVLRFTAGVL